MPVYIDGEEYNMEKIARIAQKKLMLAKRVEEMINELRKLHINDDNLEKKEILNAEMLAKHYGSSPKRNVKVLQKMKRGEWVYLARDMSELSREFKLIKAIAEAIEEMIRLTSIEERYFEAQR